VRFAWGGRAVWFLPAGLCVEIDCLQQPGL